MQALQGDIARRINGRNNSDSDYDPNDDAETTIHDLLRPAKRARHNPLQNPEQTEAPRYLDPETRNASSSFVTPRIMIDIDDLVNRTHPLGTAREDTTRDKSPHAIIDLDDSVDRTHPSGTSRKAKPLDDEFRASIDEFVMRTHPSVTRQNGTATNENLADPIDNPEERTHPPGISQKAKPWDEKVRASLDDFVMRTHPSVTAQMGTAMDGGLGESIVDDAVMRTHPIGISQEDPIHLEASKDSESNDDSTDAHDATDNPITTRDPNSAFSEAQESSALGAHHSQPSEDSFIPRPTPLTSTLNTNLPPHRPKPSNRTGPRRTPTSSLLKLHLTNKNNNNNLPNLKSRLDSLLPKMRAANAELEVERREGTLGERHIEALGEDEEESGYVEMNLGLGVLEEKDDGNKQREKAKKRRREEKEGGGKVGIEVVD